MQRFIELGISRDIARVYAYATGLLLLASIVPVFAGSTIDEPDDAWWRGGTLIPDPYRPWLEDQGIAVELVSTSDLLSNRSGGVTTDDATKTRVQNDLAVTFDLERLGLWPGGTFHVLGQSGSGTGLSEEYVGDLQTLSNIDAHDFTQLGEYWLEQSLLDARIRFKVGKQDANEDFAAVETGDDFINSSFGLIPTVPAPTFPHAALGVSAFFQLNDRLGMGAGVYDGAPDGCTTGFSTAFDDDGRIFSDLELSLTPLSGPRRSQSRYALGFWHLAGHEEEFNGEIDETYDADFGAYITVDQSVFQESRDAKQGLRLFAQLGTSSADTRSIERYVGVGLSYTGLIKGRDEDTIGLGVAHARLDDAYAHADGGRPETAVELFYKMQLFPWLSVQPDIQYIINPGCHGEDALVAGLRLETAF